MAHRAWPHVGNAVATTATLRIALELDPPAVDRAEAASNGSCANHCKWK
jgi:hypothetical protein